jgi:carbamate kinase
VGSSRIECCLLVRRELDGCMATTTRGRPYAGAEAKDRRCRPLMGRVLGIEEMMFPPQPAVALHCRTAQEHHLGRVSLSGMRRYHEEGHFPPGSMRPKIEAAMRFLEDGGRHVVISTLVRR